MVKEDFSPEEQEQICQNCRTNKYPGETYTGYYGEFFSGLYLRNIRILGSANVFLCDLCVARRLSGSKFGVVLFLFLLGGLSLLTGLIISYSSFTANDPATEDLLLGPGSIILGVVMLLAGYGYYSWFANMAKAIEKGKVEPFQNFKRTKLHEDVGDKMAIQVLRPQWSKLKYEGAPRHLTRSEYVSRRKQGRLF